MKSQPVSAFEQMKAKANRIIEIYASAGVAALWANGRGGGFWIRGTGYISMEQAEKETAAIIESQLTPQKIITLKVNDESASYDQTWRTVIVYNEDETFWHGRPFNNPKCPMLSWPKSAWKIVDPDKVGV